MNVVMPKRRAEVVAERSQRLAREMIDGPHCQSPTPTSPSLGEEEVGIASISIGSGPGFGEDVQEGLESPTEDGEMEIDSLESTSESDVHEHNDHDQLDIQLPLDRTEQEEEREIVPIPSLQTPIPLLEAPAEIIEYPRPIGSPFDNASEVQIDEFEFDTQSLADIDENENEDETEDEDGGTSFGEVVAVAGKPLSPPLPFAPVEDQVPSVEYTRDQPISIAETSSPTPPILVPKPILEQPEPLTAQAPTPFSFHITQDLEPKIDSRPPLGSRNLNTDIKINTPPPPTPLGLKKQKSLRQLLSFGLSSPSPPVPPLPLGFGIPGPGPELKKRMTLLSRQSKPNLKVEVKAPEFDEAGPASAPLPILGIKGRSKEQEREKDMERPKMVKRFSLSNMSSAFKKMAGGGGGNSPVPKVPELPAMYRRKSDQDVEQDKSDEVEDERPRRRSDDLSFRAIGSPINYSLDTPTIGSPIVLGHISPPALSHLPGSTGASVSKIAGPSTVVDTLPYTIPSGAAGLLSQPVKPRLARSTSFSSVSSVATSLQHAEPHEQQTLIAISPRTQRDPSASLQDYLTKVQSEVPITRNTHIRQQSLEATIVLSSPPPPLPRHRLMEREDSLGSLSSSHRSSGESQGERLKTPLVMPVASMSLDEIRRHIPIAPPRTAVVVMTMDETIGMGSEDSFKTLPSLGSGMVVVNSPTSTLASTSTASASATGSRNSRTSTPKARSLVRMITSPRRRQSKGKGKKKEEVAKMTIATPPPIPQSNSVKFDSMKQSIKLESLHFEALNLDFSNLDWDAELNNGRSSSKGR